MKTFEELVSSIKKNISFSREKIEESEQIINQFDDNRFTPLMIACQIGNLAAVESLLSILATDVRLDNGAPNYETALMIAANSPHSDSTKIVKKLVYHHFIDEKSLNRALIYFSSKGDAEGVQFCLDKKADVNATYLNNTALTEATYYGHLEVVDRLLSISGININGTNYRDETPLIISIYKKNEQIIKRLLERSDHQLEHISPLFGTALTTAIFCNLTETALFLISKNHHFDPNKHPGALNWAIRRENISVTKALIDSGAAVNELGDQYYCDDWPNWLWQEMEPYEYPFYVSRREPLFELPIILAIETGNQELVRLVLPKADLEKMGVCGHNAEEFIKEYTTLDMRNFIEAQKKIIANDVSQATKKPEIISSLSVPGFFSGAPSLRVKYDEPIRGELLESFTDIILTELEELSDTSNMTTKKLLIEILYEAQLTVGEAMQYAFQLDPFTNQRFWLVYCCFNPVKWDDAYMDKYRAVVLESYLERFYDKRIQEDGLYKEKKIQELKQYAHEVARQFFKQREMEQPVLSTEEMSQKYKVLADIQSTGNEGAFSDSSDEEEDIKLLKENISVLNELIAEDTTPLSVEGGRARSPIQDMEIMLKKNEHLFKKEDISIDSSVKDAWKSVAMSNERWKQFYETVKYSPKNYRVRSEKKMFHVLQAVIYKLEKGCRWRDLPQWLPPYTTVSHYYYQWKAAGLLKDILEMIPQKCFSVLKQQ